MRDWPTAYTRAYKSVFTVIEDSLSRTERSLHITGQPQAVRDALRGERDALLTCQKAMHRKLTDLLDTTIKDKGVRTG
jgi:hypothetical protein